MKLASLHDLYLEELKDIYNAESQLVKALPKIVKAVQHRELRAALSEHLEQTKGQVDRLEQIFESMGKSGKGKHCVGMEGLLEEGKEIMETGGDESVVDAGMILAAQKVEHYEIASYGGICAYADMLGEDEAADLLKQTLAEEKKADARLSQLAKGIINAQAVTDEGGERDKPTAREIKRPQATRRR